jgi:hypothetical protein
VPRSGIASVRQLELPLGNHGDESTSGTGSEQVGPRPVEIESELSAGHRATVALLSLPRAAEPGRLTENTQSTELPYT